MNEQLLYYRGNGVKDLEKLFFILAICGSGADSI